MTDARPAVPARARHTGRTLAICLLLAAPGAVLAQDGAADRARDAAGEDQRISEYDFAVSRAMQALMAAGPDERRATLYVARKEGDLWHVYFGSFDLRSPRFDLAYEVVQEAPGSGEFEVRKYEQEVPADAELTRAAMALMTALDVFEPRDVRFYTYVWRDDAGRWVTYFAPEVVGPPGTVRRAADQRVVVSPDARRVLESRYAEADELRDGPAPWSAVSGDQDRPTAADFLHIFLAPQYAPFALITRRLVCEMNWDGEIERCVVGGAR